jgi:DNA-binding transcriptional MerR regulator
MSYPLTIGELVRRTGVAEPTLRMWERRHGFPNPTRTPTGHRRYSLVQVEQIQRVVAGRAAGLSLTAAIERATHSAAPEHLSLFATIRQELPELQPRLIAKPAMLAFSHAIEDECLARAEPRVLFGCFQREIFYRQAQKRWQELAEGAVAAVFADFPGPADPIIGAAEVPISTMPALSREWSLVCYGATVVRDIGRACAEAATVHVPAVDERAAQILALEPAAGPQEQLRLATAVIDRTLSLLT